MGRARVTRELLRRYKKSAVGAATQATADREVAVKELYAWVNRPAQLGWLFFFRQQVGSCCTDGKAGNRNLSTRQFLLPCSRVRHLLTTPSDQGGEELN